MNQEAEQQAQKLRQELACLQQSNLSFSKQIEQCFAISKITWHKLRAQIQKHLFATVEEENHFFKNIKPLFTSEVEYFNLLYSATLFKPQDGEGHVYPFWIRELYRVEHFIVEHHEFYHYTSCFTYLNKQYFTRHYTNKPPPSSLELQNGGGQNVHSNHEKLFFKKGRLYKIHNGRPIVKKQKGFSGTDKKWKPWYFESDD